MTGDPAAALAAQVAQLTARVAMLENRPPRRSEALSPSYLRVDPATGQTSAVFPGGVQINAGRTSTPPNERRVRWVTDDTGVLIADLIGASADDKSASLNMVAHAHAGTGRGLVGAIDDLGAQAGLYGLVGSPGQPAAVTAYTTNQSAKVLDDTGASDFAPVGVEWRHELHPLGITDIASSGFNSRVVDAGSYLGGWRQSSGANGDYLEYDVYMAPGTWQLNVMGSADANRGRVGLVIDGTDQGVAVDFYAGALQRNIAIASQSIAVGGPASVRTVQLYANGRNPSSAGFYLCLQEASLVRTS